MKGRATLLLVLLLGALSAFGATRMLLGTRNTLDLNGNWSSGKLELEKAVIGAAATMVTRVTLSRDRLDLSVYEGFQLFLHEAESEIGSFVFDYRSRDAYLHVLFGPATGPLTGIRLGHDERFDELTYRVAETGRFLSQRRVDLRSHLNPGGTNRVRLRFGAAGAVLELNGQVALDLPGDFSAIRRVGVRGPRQAVSVDDVELHSVDGRVLLVETFRNRRDQLAWWLGMTAGSSVVAFGLLGWGRARPLWIRRLVLAAALTVTVSVWIAYAVDWERLSRRYPQTADEIDFGDHENRIETSEEVLARLRVELAAPTRGAERILLVGTSQTWGAGALRDDETVARRLGQLLSESRPTTVIAAAVPGSNAAELLGHYRDEWIEWGPDLVVINLSSNDRDQPDFGAEIRAFLELNAERGIETLLVAEANSIEAVHSIAHNHVVLAELAADTDVELLDMHEYLADQLDRGWLWWDFVHLTSFGQDLFARRLAEAITARD